MDTDLWLSVGEKWEQGKGREIEVQSTTYETNKLQGCIVQHRLQYVMTINGT